MKNRPFYLNNLTLDHINASKYIICLYPSTANAKADHPLQPWDTTPVLIMANQLPKQKKGGIVQKTKPWQQAAPHCHPGKHPLLRHHLRFSIRGVTAITCAHHEVPDILVTSWNPLLSITGIFPWTQIQKQLLFAFQEETKLSLLWHWLELVATLPVAKNLKFNFVEMLVRCTSLLIQSPSVWNP